VIAQADTLRWAPLLGDTRQELVLADPGSVGAIQVGDLESAFCDRDLGVMSRDLWIIQDDIIISIATDGDLLT